MSAHPAMLVHYRPGRPSIKCAFLQHQLWASFVDAGPSLNEHTAMCLAIIGLEQCWASGHVRHWWDSDGSL